MRLLFILLILGLAATLEAQNPKVISYNAYMSMVLDHHPMTSVADIQLDEADALLRMARGGFDPNVGGTLARKDFEGKRYYDLLEAGLKVPTWLGITLEGGFTRNDGVFLNPEATTPDDGLLHAGVSIPLGRGLFIDERRAELKRAKLARGQATAERQLILNELLLDAGIAYWDWFLAYHSLQVYEEAVDVATQRFQAVKASALLGDRPAIDTLEASIQVQSRQLQAQQAALTFRNTGEQLAVFLWLDGLIPMQLDQQAVPPELDAVQPRSPTDTLITGFERLVAAHPMLSMQSIEIERMLVEQRLKRELLKPQLDLKYNALMESFTAPESMEFNRRDYTLGVEFSMPILLRKERGAAKLASLKVNEKRMDLAVKQQDIRMKGRTALNEWGVTIDQLDLFERTALDYEALLNGERTLFRAGESSLFLVNSRESKYIEAQVKLIELKIKNRLAELKTLYALANINPEP